MTKLSGAKSDRRSSSGNASRVAGDGLQRSPSTGLTPTRRPASVRRTSTVDCSWPAGMRGPQLLRGASRDFLTGRCGRRDEVLDEAFLEVTVSVSGDLISLDVRPDEPGLRALIGRRVGRGFRRALKESLPLDPGGTVLNSLLDDLPGASLVANWAWTRQGYLLPDEASGRAGRAGVLVGVCAGFRPGSQALDGEGRQSAQRSMPVPMLRRDDDPAGWHDMPQQEGVALRRARRCDIWLDDGNGCIWADAGFQDSAISLAEQQRVAVHEYRVLAKISRTTFHLQSIEVVPLILPYDECLAAAAAAQAMVGRPAADFREMVPETLSGAVGCTHLNDVLRSLADVPGLAATLDDEALVASQRI